MFSEKSPLQEYDIQLPVEIGEAAAIITPTVNPSTWEELSYHLSTVTAGTFNDLSHFMRSTQSANRKESYHGHYQNLTSLVTIAAYSGIGKGSGITENELHPIIHTLFFKTAPIHIKLRLARCFPNEFDQYLKELYEDITESAADRGWEQQPTQLFISNLLTVSKLLPIDHHEHLFTTVAETLTQPAQNVYQTYALLSACALMNRDRQTADQAKTENDPTTLIESIADQLNMLDMDNPRGQALRTTLLETVITPTIKETLTPRINAIWNDICRTDRTNLEHKLAIQIPQLIFQQFPTAVQEFPQIADTIVTTYCELAGYYNHIAFFPDCDRYGNTQFLFAHQVEAIRQMVETGRLLLTDEPGLGKTLTLALGALNRLAEKKGPTKENPAHILIISQKPVLDNWMKELPLRVNTADIAATNLSQISIISDRIKAFDEFVNTSDAPYQIMMVNLDIFRNEAFLKRLKKWSPDSVIIDETHHIKTSNLYVIDSILPRMGYAAGRTKEIYEFLSHHKGDVYLATATPFVNNVLEILSLAHRTDPELFDATTIQELINNPVALYQKMRRITLRHKKESVAELPEKTVTLYPLLVDPVHVDTQKLGIIHALQTLNAESEYKQPWLVQKVHEILKHGEKVVIFTPYVDDEKENVASMTTKHIARLLVESGIVTSTIDVIDGSVSQNERDRIRSAFQQSPAAPGSIRVLIGNYKAIGEGITLCSDNPDNVANNCILYNSPYTIAQYLQAIDRIHRLNQQHPVQIHIPVVVSNNPHVPTYDGRIVSELTKDERTFNAVVDGVFFTTPLQDALQRIVASEKHHLTQTERSPSFFTPALQEIVGVTQDLYGNPLFHDLWQHMEWYTNLSRNDQRIAYQHILRNKDTKTEKHPKTVSNIINKALVPLLDALLSDKTIEEQEETITLIEEQFPLLSPNDLTTKLNKKYYYSYSHRNREEAKFELLKIFLGISTMYPPDKIKPFSLRAIIKYPDLSSYLYEAVSSSFGYSHRGKIDRYDLIEALQGVTKDLL